MKQINFDEISKIIKMHRRIYFVEFDRQQKCKFFGKLL